MKKVSLKRGLELLGFTNIEVHKNYNYRSGFMDKDGQTWYFLTSDLRFCKPANVTFLMCRTAKDRKDYTGGQNQYFAVPRLAEMGYVLKIPRIKCDYNQA